MEAKNKLLHCHKIDNSTLRVFSGFVLCKLTNKIVAVVVAK